MYRFSIKGAEYSYLVGSSTVGIISATSHKKYFRTIEEVRGSRTTPETGIQNGTSDSRLTADEIAAYVTEHQLD